MALATAARPLDSVTMVEAATFVAAPLSGMSLAQLGAAVIRVDLPGGGSDLYRWPLEAGGRSLYWANLNKGKKSVTLDYRMPEGRDLLIALAAAPASGGIFIDNMAGHTRISYEELCALRADMIHAHVEGRSDGGPSLDYMANSAVGIPQMTGSENSGEPVNHVLPAWDLLTGMTLAAGILAALVRRGAEGRGSRIELALNDVALWSVGNLGWLAAADLDGAARRPGGNDVYGAFGTDFRTRDGRRVMVVALTAAQWQALVEATATDVVFGALEASLDVDFRRDLDRYTWRATLSSILHPWFAAHDYDEVAHRLDAGRVLWGPYYDMAEAARMAREAGSLVREITHPGIGPSLAAGSPLRWQSQSEPPAPAPELGADTDEILIGALGLNGREIGGLYERGVVCGPRAVTGRRRSIGQ